MSKFKHAAFIELNTPEIRERLKKLGYYVIDMTSKGDILFTTRGGEVASLSTKNRGFLADDTTQGSSQR